MKLGILAVPGGGGGGGDLILRSQASEGRGCSAICFLSAEVVAVLLRIYKQVKCYDPGDGSHSFIGNQAAGQARGHHGSQVTNQQGVT